jgi:cysteine sulfinate desulfinase/cysteine desulfurase-like protein
MKFVMEEILMNMTNLDYISNNPLLSEVKNAMIQAIQKDYGNPRARTN